MTETVATYSRFGACPPSLFQSWMMLVGSHMPPTRLGRRVCTFLRSVLRRISDGPIDAVVLGHKMRLYPYGNASEKRLLVSPQYFDQRELVALDEVIRPDFMFVDVGANVGAYSLFVATRAGPKARVLAIEPHPQARERLACNLAMNDVDWVSVAPVAVTDRETEIVLHLDSANIGSTSAVASHVGRPSGLSINVEGKTLLSLLETYGFERIDALKIDIEGHEDLALMPFFENAPEQLFPSLLIIEDNQKVWRCDLYAQLARSGYIEKFRDNGNALFVRHQIDLER
jgi:FkbM family methyltransferase